MGLMLTGEKMESYYYYILLYIVLDGIHQKNTIFVYNIRIYHQLSKIHIPTSNIIYSEIVRNAKP